MYAGAKTLVVIADMHNPYSFVRALRQTAHIKSMHRFLLCDIYLRDINIRIDGRVDIILKRTKLIISQRLR